MSIKKVEFCECDKGALHKYYYDLIMSNIAEISHKNIKIEAVFDFFKNVDSVSGVTDFDNVLVKSYKDDVIEIEDDDLIPIRERMIELHTLCASIYNINGVHRDTIEHLSNVREYTKIICQFLRCNDMYCSFLDKKTTDLISIGALLHDISKIIMDDKFLYDSRKYNAEERVCINTHPLISSIMIDYMIVVNPNLKKLLEHIKTSAIQHHENVDGSGYPAGLVEKEISLGGLIIRVADSYDAIIAKNRKYKKPFGVEQAKNEIISKVGSLYNNDIVESLNFYLESSLETEKILNQKKSCLV